MIMGDMNHRAILDIGFFPDGDGLVITPDNRHRPDRNIPADMHPADYQCCFIDISTGIDYRAYPLIGSYSHQLCNNIENETAILAELSVLPQGIRLI
jgi:hypothetical protein